MHFEEGWQQESAEGLNLADDVGHAQLEQSQKVTKYRVDAHSIAEDEIGCLRQTDFVVPAELLPGGLLLFLLQPHPRYQVHCSQDEGYF